MRRQGSEPLCQNAPNHRLRTTCLCMRRVQSLLNLLVALATCVFLCGVRLAQGQEIEPRAYANAPVGVNFLIVGYAFTRGGVPSNSALPVTDPRLDTNSAVLGYARVLDLWGMSGKFDAIVPYSWLSGTELAPRRHAGVPARPAQLG